MAMNSDSASIVGRWPSADVAQQQHHVLRVDAAAAAWPSVRISIIVSTMVRMTTSVRAEVARQLSAQSGIE